jgi:hypothetical protein
MSCAPVAIAAGTANDMSRASTQVVCRPIAVLGSSERICALPGHRPDAAPRSPAAEARA